jgi:L-amino acid N-acyltransferase YncA
LWRPFDLERMVERAVHVDRPRAGARSSRGSACTSHRARHPFSRSGFGRARRRRDGGAFARRPSSRRDGDHGDRAQAGRRRRIARRAAGPLIRPVTADDAERARVLNEAIADGRYSLLDTPFSVAAEREYIATFPARGIFNVAELDGAGIIAAQSLEPFSQYTTHEHDHVLSMGTWVSEPFRRRGIAGRLAEVSFATARERGFEKVLTDIRADNLPSLAFHMAYGFTVVGTARRQARVGDRYVDVVFVERFL